MQWSEVYQYSGDGLSDITFLSEQLGFACGGKRFEKAAIVKTTDGGQSWQEVSLPTGGEQKRLYGICANAKGDVYSIGLGGVLFYSHDSGSVWQQRQEPAYKEWHDITFRSDTALVFCARGSLNDGFISTLSSTTNNFSWFTKHSFAMTDVDFPTPNIGYISGYGAVYKTTDGGNTWNFLSPKNDFFNGMCWYNALEGIVIGWEGTICKTTDGGATWNTIRNGNSPLLKKIRMKAIEKNSRDELIIVGDNGCVLQSVDRGEHWIALKNEISEDLEAVYFSNDLTFFAVGNDGAIFKFEL